MTEERYLTLGPQPPYETKRYGYIALNKLRSGWFQIGSDFVIGKECDSLQEIEFEVDQIRNDLDEIVRLSRERFRT
jgi:hypothetical protein